MENFERGGNNQTTLPAEAEAPILWLPDEKSRLFGKDPDLGKIEGKRKKGLTG